MLYALIQKVGECPPPSVHSVTRTYSRHPFPTQFIYWNRTGTWRNAIAFGLLLYILSWHLLNIVTLRSIKSGHQKKIYASTVRSVARELIPF